MIHRILGLIKMAVPTFETIESKFFITIYDTQLLQSEHFDLEFRGCQWKFYVEKGTNENGDGIIVHLECIFPNDDSLDSFIATAQIELKSFDDHTPSHIDRIAPREFSCVKRKWSQRFIDWENLINPVKHYIDDNQIQMVVTVTVDELKKRGQDTTVDFHVLDSGTESSELKLGLTFSKLSKVSAVLSPEFLIFDMPMRIQIYKNNDSLSVYIWPHWRTVTTQKLNIQSKFKLLAYKVEDNAWLSNDDNATAYERNTGTHEIGMDSAWIGFEHFISWNDLKKSHMAPDASIRMEIEIKGIKPIATKRKWEDEEQNVARASTSGSNGNVKIMKLSDGSPIRCSRCCDDMFVQTLFVVTCGHIYCITCIDTELRKCKVCVKCNDILTFDKPLQIILFD